MNIKIIYVVLFMSLFSSQAYSSASLSNLPSIDVTPIHNLIEKLHVYKQDDQHIKELSQVLSTQETAILQYNELLTSSAHVTFEQQQSLSQDSFQDLIQVSTIELDSLAELSSVIMQTKNFDPSWQIKNYGNFKGSLLFVKNLFTPQSWKSSLFGCAGALTGLAALQILPRSSTTININLPSGVDRIHVSSDSQQKLLASLAACTLGAGAVIAASQFYNSWMYEKNSRDLLTDKIKAIKQSNCSISNKFDIFGIHNGTRRLESALQEQRSDTQRVEAGVSRVEAGVSRVEADVSKVNQCLVEVKSSVHGLHEIFESRFSAISEAFLGVNTDLNFLKNSQSNNSDMLLNMKTLLIELIQLNNVNNKNKIIQNDEENTKNLNNAHSNVKISKNNRPIKNFVFHNNMSAHLFEKQFALSSMLKSQDQFVLPFIENTSSIQELA